MSENNELAFAELNNTIVRCKLCERLVLYREIVPPRASFKNEIYWRKPLPGFGDQNAWLLILGLAPAAHGGNRTGRIFTGDESGNFLFRALFNQGFANQPTSKSIDDGLKLTGCFITAAVKCAPPENKPLPQECLNCFPYLETELELLKNVKSVLVLGKFAFDTFKAYAKKRGHSTKGMVFGFGKKYSLPNLPTIYVSYHVSQQNTFTGMLTQEMFEGLFEQIKEDSLKVLP